MKIVCDCGHESEFQVIEETQRQFFKQSEEVKIGEFKGFSIDLANPAVMSFEIGCKKCGTFFQVVGRML